MQTKLRQVYDALGKLCSSNSIKVVYPSDITFTSAFLQPMYEALAARPGLGGHGNDEMWIQNLRIEVAPTVPIFDFFAYRDFHFDLRRAIGLYADNELEPGDHPRLGKKALNLGRLRYSEEYGLLERTIETSEERTAKVTVLDSEEGAHSEHIEGYPVKKPDKRDIKTKLVRVIELATFPMDYRKLPNDQRPNMGEWQLKKWYRANPDRKIGFLEKVGRAFTAANRVVQGPKYGPGSPGYKGNP